MRSRFTGDLTGTGVAELPLCGVDDAQAGYLGQERVAGAHAGPEETFVIQHGGIVDGTGQGSVGTIVADSATGDLRGNARFMHDEQDTRAV